MTDRPFAQLPSTTPFAPHRTARRLDPYWDGIWQHGSHAQWVSHEHLQRLERAGLAARRPAALRSDPTEASERIDADWDSKLDLLGVLSSWRTVTAEQAAAFSGATSISGHRRVIADLFALDLIDAGAIGAALGGRQSSHGRMYRPSASRAFDRIIRPRLSFAEWVSVTGGLKFLTGGQYDRHNVLTAELALRAAEFLNVGAVLGERQAHVNTLAYTGFGLPEPPGRSQQTADAVIVRGDGARIAVETTASAGAAGFARKAEAWARLLARRPFDDTGLVVVFVVADRASSDRHTGDRNNGSLSLTVRKHVARAARLNPGTSSNRVADRMFVVDWRDWFPARGTASEDFLLLRAQRPSGRAGEWLVADLLDDLDVPTPARMDAPSAVIENASGLRGTPRQLRAGTRPDLHRIPLEHAGFDGPLQVRVDPRTGAARADLRRPRGSASRVTVPTRLRF